MANHEPARQLLIYFCCELGKLGASELDRLIMALTDDMLKQKYSGSCDDGMLYAEVVKYAAYLRKARE